MKRRLKFLVAAITAVLPFSAFAQDGAGSVRLGVEIPVSIVNVPMFMTIDRLKEKGVEVSIVEFQSPETMTLALRNGEVDFIGTSAGTTFSAIDAGLEGKAFLGMAMSDFLMVAKKDLTTCQSLDGKNVGVQSREGTTGVLTIRWLEAECPDARPNVLIVPGSENRVAGLIAGQLDASPIDSQNTAQLMALKPGEFTTIESFSKAGVLASLYFASNRWLEEQAPTVKVLVEEYNAVVNDITKDRSEFARRTKELLPDTDPEIVQAVVDGYVDRKVLVPVSGVQPDVIEDALEFYGSARPYAKIKTAEDVATTEFVTGREGQ